jgi:hypothetical protein
MILPLYPPVLIIYDLFVGPSPGLDDMKKRIIYFLFLESNPDSSVSQPVA